ncbi:MAG: TonB-dependent receptor [Puniceicoccales bacterium]|jgi:vitamin B12 transporter|nr:TonB-dependent receptor [Puniceicoccales bacterium]
MKKDTLSVRSNAYGFSRKSLRAAAILIPLFGAGLLMAAEPSTSGNTAEAAKKSNAASTASEADSAKALDPIVVVASRLPEHLSQVSPSVSYVGELELAPMGNYTLTDVLREQQGVYVAGYGATGASSSIFTRGADSRMTQVTLDGRRMNAGFGNFDSSTLLMDNLSSVQMMRGASSTLYGANAMAGVIDLRLVDPLALDRPIASISGEGGSYGYWRTGFQVAGKMDQISMADSGSADGALNVASPDNNSGLGVSIGGSWTETDNKRPNNHYRIANIMPRLDYQMSENLTFNVVARYYDYDMGMPGDNTVPGGYDGLSRQSGYNWLVSPGFKIKVNEDAEVQAFYSYTKNNLFSSSRYWDSWGGAWSPLEDAENNADKHEISILGSWRINEMLTISGGYTFEKTLLDKRSITYGSYYDARRDSNSPWFQAQVTPIDDLKISAGVRYNQFNTYDDAWTGEANISYRIAPTDTTLYARVANAYAVPDEATIAYGYSADGLEPEKNLSWEIGAKQKLDVLRGAQFSVVYFENFFRDMIQWDYMTYRGYNINKAKTRGVELSGEIRPIDQIRVFANATYLHTENKQTGARLVRRPDWTGTLGVEAFPVESLTLGFSVTYVHGVEDIDAVTYMQVDNKNYYYGRVYANWRFWEHAELFGRIENLFDQDYWTANGYPSLPITAYGGMRFMF